MRLETVSSDSRGRPITPSRRAPSISSRVVLASRTVPSAANVRNPQGARSRNPSIEGLPPRQLGLLDVRRGEVRLDCLDRFLGIAHVRTMTGRPELVQSAARHLAREVVA